MSIDLSSLNENQRQAVEWDEGPLLLLAGPGSGKTRVLTYRIARLLEMSPNKHFNILGLTFTNKAAGEMRSRIEGLVSNARERTLLTTFHSFCAKILRQHGNHIGLHPDFTILSQDHDREAILHEAIKQTGEIETTAQRLLPFINGLLNNCVAIEEVESLLVKNNVDNTHKLAAIYRNYRQLLKKTNSLDFASIILEALELLTNKPAIRKQIPRIYTHICVDEFQDTNMAQYKVLKQLVHPDSPNLFIVADDDQIIYQWNGASPERLNELRQDFEIKEIQLPENYRCPAEVIEIANRLIVNNLSRSQNKQKLRSAKVARNTSLRIKHFATFDEERDWVAKDISSRPESERIETVVLARTRKLLDGVVQALQNNGLNGYVPIRKDDFQSAPMQWLHAILRLANSRQDREQLRRICQAFYRLEGINLNVDEIISNAAISEGDYLRSWRDMVLKRHSELSAPCLKIVTEDVSKLLDYMNFLNLLKNAFDWFNKFNAEEPFNDYQQEKSVWENIYTNIKSNYGEEQLSLHLLLQELDLNSKTPEPPKNAIRCYTIHAAKGLEFKHVYLIGLVEEQLPSWGAVKKGNNSPEIEEERRNCFVAITRAEISLTLSYADNYFRWTKKPSRFLQEMGLILCQKSSTT
ncbi:ATP-depentend DNA helicase [Candidatus Thiomargarita nelsonii]|uniref:DNA 3'-5' helicase n=1 Tax=Candidatus Thiomargarita nelsonii TaxID=1003181 RepID=A0A4E0R495_9GAMM|nr:ATP-depentend DNA helicase [Candidatus Thiomargarita nelsonii]